MTFSSTSLMCCVVVSCVGVSYGSTLGLQKTARKTRKRDVNGFTMGAVKYDGGEIKTGEPGEWEWTEDASGEIRKYKIAGRDQWSVYLCGENGGDPVQLDYWTGQVSRKRVVVQNITDASKGAVTGRNIGMIQFAGGEYRNVGWKRWELHLHSGAFPINYTEKVREPWGIELNGAGPKNSIYADYQREWISSISRNKLKTDLHKIRNANYSTVQYRVGCGMARANEEISSEELVGFPLLYAHSQLNC